MRTIKTLLAVLGLILCLLSSQSCTNAEAETKQEEPKYLPILEIGQINKIADSFCCTKTDTAYIQNRMYVYEKITQKYYRVKK